MKKSQFGSGLYGTAIGKKGQALIEYMLVLVITVSLVMLVMNYMFKPFGEFIDNYMGAYTRCLLEYGELPTLGGDESPVDADSECAKKFKAASISEGRPPVNGNGRNPASGGGRNSNSQSGRDGAGDEEGGGGSSSSSSSVSSSSSSRGSGRNGRLTVGRQGRYGAEANSSEVANGKVVEIALDSGANGGFFRSSDSGGSRRAGEKVRYVAITGMTDAEKKQIEKKAAGTAKTTTMNTGGEQLGPTPKKLIVKPPESAPLIEEEQKEFSVGNFFRYLFIGALIIALIVFIGGQGLKMSKEL